MRIAPVTLACALTASCAQTGISRLSGIPVLLGPKLRIAGDGPPPAERPLFQVRIKEETEWARRLPAAVELPSRCAADNGAPAEERRRELRLTEVEAGSFFWWACCGGVWFIPFPIGASDSGVDLHGTLTEVSPGPPEERP